MDPLTFIDDHAEALITLARDLVRTRSVNPPGDERAAAVVAQRAAQRFGLEDSWIEEFEPGRANLLVRLRGPECNRRLLFVSHLDTKPVGNAAEWTVPPFEGVRHEGRLYGLGACDAKASVAAMVGAAGALAAADTPVAGELLLVLAADEEGPSTRGVQALVARGLTADAAIVGEPAGIHDGFDFLHVAGRGMFSFRVRVHGNQTHSGLSDVLHPVNANLKAAQLLLRLHDGFRPRFDPHPAFPTGPTVNAGTLFDCRGAYGVIPGEAEFVTDVRVIPGMQREGLQAEVAAFLEHARASDPDLDAEVVADPGRLGWSAPQEIASDHALVQHVRAAMRRVLGREPVTGGYPATTDARYLSTAGIPTLPALGPGRITLAHAPDEWVAEREIVDGAKIYALGAAAFLGMDGT